MRTLRACQTLLPKVEYFFVQLNWHESHCYAQYVTKITLTSGALQHNPDFFCYGKYKNDNIIMVILLRIVDNSTTCWLESRAFHGQQNYLITNVDATTKDAGECVGCGFLFPTTCGGFRSLFIWLPIVPMYF